MSKAERNIKTPERRCIVTREVSPREGLIRFVLSPDGVVTPDLAEKLGGRGAWVSSRRDEVEAAGQGHFARGFKGQVTLPPDLAQLVEDGLAKRVLSLLGLAQRAGLVAAGIDQVRAMVRSDAPSYMVEAADSAEDGRRKTLGLAKALYGNDVPVLGCFTRDELGAALGMAPVTHAGVANGPLAERFVRECARLSGFRALMPQSWAANGPRGAQGDNISA